jgi:hypothetical protein
MVADPGWTTGRTIDRRAISKILVRNSAKQKQLIARVRNEQCLEQNRKTRYRNHFSLRSATSRIRVAASLSARGGDLDPTH